MAALGQCLAMWGQWLASLGLQLEVLGQWLAVWGQWLAVWGQWLAVWGQMMLKVSPSLCCLPGCPSLSLCSAGSEGVQRSARSLAHPCSAS